MDEVKKLLSQIQDINKRCIDNQMITFGKFLDMHERSLVKSMKAYQGSTCIFYGGFPEAERTIPVFIPEYITAKTADELAEYFSLNPDDSPILLLKVSKDRFSRELTHRDYLGAIMALGLTRDIIGDIFVHSDGCEIAVMKNIGPFICENLTQAGRGTLSCTLLPFSEVQKPEETKSEETSFTVSSLRLDNIVKNAFGVSRDSACRAIEQGLVFVNDIQCEKIDKKVTSNDKITFRHKGRFIIDSCSDQSKKGRLIIKGKRQ